MIKWSFAFVALCSLGGCSSLPVAGPSNAAIEQARVTDATPDGIDLIDLDRATVDRISAFRAPQLDKRFADRRPSPILTVGVGDSLVVSIFEAGAGGLFSASAGTLSASSKSVTLQPQTVSADGNISIPYAGQISVAGRTTAQIQKAIVDKLRDKAIEPQALVTVSSSRSNLVTVDGDVGGAARVPLSSKGDRLLDVIAAAGGVKGAAGEVFVRLTRDGVTASAPLRTLLEDPPQNIWARPGDQIFVYREPQTFTALGATERSGNFPFEFERMTLAQAIGAAAGLNDDKAEPGAVFLFRQERAELVCAIKGEHPCAGGGPRPVVYRLDMRAAQGIQLAQRVLIRNYDVLYTANAEGAELYKVLRIIGAGTSGVNGVATTAAKASAM